MPTARSPPDERMIPFLFHLPASAGSSEREYQERSDGQNLMDSHDLRCDPRDHGRSLRQEAFGTQSRNA